MLVWRLEALSREWDTETAQLLDVGLEVQVSLTHLSFGEEFCRRNDADIVGVRSGCTFTGWTGTSFDGEKFSLTAGMSDRWHLSFSPFIGFFFYLGGLSLQSPKCMRHLTRTFYPSSVIVDLREFCNAKMLFALSD